MSVIHHFSPENIHHDSTIQILSNSCVTQMLIWLIDGQRRWPHAVWNSIYIEVHEHMSKKGIPTASMMMMMMLMMMLMMMMMTTCFSWETSLVLKRHHDAARSRTSSSSDADWVGGRASWPQNGLRTGWHWVDEERCSNVSLGVNQPPCYEYAAVCGIWCHLVL